MSDQARELREQAEKKLTSFSWFGLNKEARAQDAADLFKRAANQYKMAKNWNEAGMMFRRAAEVISGPDLGDHSGAVSYFQDAATCFKKVAPKEAIAELNKAVSVYIDMGRFSQAASTQKKIAEMYEDMVDFESALTAYRTAAGWYQGEDDVSNNNKCLTKVALFESQLENYREAADIFESIATFMADEKLLHWSCKDYFFKAGVCAMLFDAIVAKEKMAQYVQAYAAFENSAEYKFFIPAIDVLLNEGSDDELADLITVLSRSVRLDDWSVTMLFRVKKGLSNEEDDL